MRTIAALTLLLVLLTFSLILTATASPAAFFVEVRDGERIHYQYTDGLRLHDCQASVITRGYYTDFRAWCWNEGPAAYYALRPGAIMAESPRVPRVTYLRHGALTVSSNEKEQVYHVWLPAIER